MARLLARANPKLCNEEIQVTHGNIFLIYSTEPSLEWLSTTITSASIPSMARLTLKRHCPR